nr:MAG TPA: hypothetical protein [Caudoviricetes sp.]
MIYGEYLAMIKMNKYANAFGESTTDSSTYDKFFSIQEEFIKSYVEYTKKISSIIHSIDDDVEIRVITKVPYVEENLLEKFDKEYSEVVEKITNIPDNITLPESSYEKIEDRVAKEPPFIEVSNLKDYLNYYSLFVSVMDEFSKRITEKLFFLQENLTRIKESSNNGNMDSKIDWYLNILSVVRKYLIKYVEYGESFKSTIDDD